MAQGPRRRWLWWLTPAAAVGLGWLVWTFAGEPQAAPVSAAPPSAGARPAANTSSQQQAAASAAPFSAAGANARQMQLALWQQRLERAQSALDAYRSSTRYPHESRPASEHPDQMQPNQPVAEDHAFRMPGTTGSANGLQLKTTQERVFVQGSESVRFTVSLRDSDGKALPLRIVRAAAREVPPARTASLYPEVPLDFNDDGNAGDAAAADGVYSARLQPATQGFAGLLGQIRVQVFMQYRDLQGFTYFDIVYSGDAPASWQGGPREALEDGSLNFYLKADVREAGRYVVTGRIDDASGKPFALLTFNEEVQAGPQEFKLTLFGKLVRDAKPQFPLTLRDVDGFLLRPDAYPDRKLMPRLPGKLLASKEYPLASFADAEWSSEERDRYLSELSRDVTQAQTRIDQLATGP